DPVHLAGSRRALARSRPDECRALDAAGTFRADSVLAKHDETYMPKEVADALKKQGYWKDDNQKKLGAVPQGRTQ
ncbi:MAG: cytochrome c-type biosis protein CcmE, partial [Alphaproteobacteria bacterium]|nr:cytochrome c-type biosis protein CcmE [Alphaproteobacteria bacterium]